MRNRPFLVFLCGLAFLALPGCMLPETSSRLQIGSATATLPKNDAFKSVEYEETKPDGSHYKFVIKGASADPSAALTAYTAAQAGTVDLLKELVGKIPNVPLPVPGIPPLIAK